MKKLTEKEYKKLLVDLLVKFDNLCNKNNINYSLAFGTLIGAIRHKGFIPWDDDIDVMMTRENYEKLKSLKNNEKLDDCYILTNDDSDYNLMFAKFVDKKTLLVQKHKDRFKNDYGLFIDIFPIDYIGNDINKIKKIRNKIDFYNSLLLAAQWKRFFINKNYNIKRQIIRFVFYIMSRFIKSKKIIKKLEKFRFMYKTKYMAFPYSSKTWFRYFDGCLFEEYSICEFEGKHFQCIKNFDTNLRIIYGDYMKLPPKNKRFAPHNYEVYLKE